MRMQQVFEVVDFMKAVLASSDLGCERFLEELIIRLYNMDHVQLPLILIESYPTYSLSATHSIGAILTYSGQLTESERKTWVGFVSKRNIKF